MANCSADVSDKSDAKYKAASDPPTAINPALGHVFIATYGSLRRGMSNYHVNALGDGKLFCSGRTREKYSLFRCGTSDYPCLSLRSCHPHAHTIVVDVFEVLLHLLYEFSSIDQARGQGKNKDFLGI
jgi:gamma-glutamylcyclotransferase (GGCT)/AIG2-like uncharacterized protein YtfP